MVEASPARRRRQLGELLLDEHLVTPDQLNRALEIHRATGERLGRVLLDMGVVDQEHIARVLSQQIGIEFLHLTGQSLREDVLQLLPATLASQLQAVPVAKENGILTVAMVDPLDVVAIDDIRRHTGMDVKVAVITTRDFQYALNQYPVLDVAEELVRDLPRPQVLDEEISLERLRRMADEQPVVRLVNRLTEEAVRKRASDIHIEPQERHIRLRYRVDGVLLTRGTLPEYVQAQVVSRIKIMANMDIAERRLPQDGSFQTRVDGRAIDVRVSTIPSFYGEKAVLRLLDKSAPIYDLDKLGLSAQNYEVLRRIIQRPQGIFLLTGPTGSGKTTTLYAILNQLNNEKVNVLTVEDPVEYQIAGITQMQVNVRGGVAIFEIAEMDDELRHLVINRVPHHTLKEAAVAAGMTTLLEDGLKKAAAGVTSLAEVWRVVQVERANGPEEPTDGNGETGERGNATADVEAVARSRDPVLPRSR